MKQNDNIAAKADKNSTETKGKQGYGPVKDGIRQYLPTGVYFLFQQINGKLYRDSLETTDPEEAVKTKKDLIDKIKGDLKKGIDAKKAQLWSYYETKYRENLDHRVELHKSGEKDGLAEGSVKNYRLGLSDTIRTIWAYLVGLLEVARKGDTNHPGLLILDEPRQQSADKVSFGALLKRVASASASGQQVIFATSEEEQSLQTMLEGIPHELHSLSERVIQPVQNTESAS